MDRGRSHQRRPSDLVMARMLPRGVLSHRFFSLSLMLSLRDSVHALKHWDAGNCISKPRSAFLKSNCFQSRKYFEPLTLATRRIASGCHSSRRPSAEPLQNLQRTAGAFPPSPIKDSPLHLPENAAPLPLPRGR